MRTLTKTLVTVAVLLGAVLGVYYGYRRSVAKDNGEEYAFSRAPGDLIREIASLIPKGDDKPSAPPPVETAPEPEPAKPDTPPAAPDTSVMDRAREHFEAGEYEAAIPLLYRAMSAPGASGERPRELLARCRLYLVLLEGASKGEALGGDPVALLTTAAGETMLVTVTDETDTKIAFRRDGGISARVPKKSLESIEVARTKDKRTYLFESEYRRRVESADTAPEMLELARDCWREGLLHHVTYLLDGALAKPGSDLELLVAKKHGEAERAGVPERLALTRDLLVHFWSRGEYARRALAGHETPAVAAAAPDVLAAGDGPEPPSGIGGTVVRTPRGADPELNALLDRADRLKQTADEHYAKAQPGSADAASHRKQAIDAYREALETYERVNEKWGVNLESTFHEIQERLYQMLKDSPAR